MSPRWIAAAALLLLSGLGCQSPERPGSSRPGSPEEPAAEEGRLPGLGTEYRAASAWSDSSEGPKATFIYVSVSGTRDEPKPFPVIYSSDPENRHFHGENSDGKTVRRLTREEMTQFFEVLEREGLRGLPWSPQEYDASIGPERALYLYQDGRRQRVAKRPLGPAAKADFTRVERAIIALTRAE